MPLVTRFADRGSFFRQATEPPNWLNGDLWVDTDNSNLAVNRSGTSVQTALGTFVQGDILHASSTDTLTRLAKGNDNEVLTMTATVPNWEAVAAGGGKVVKLGETELSGAGTSLLIDSLSIDMDPAASTFSHLLFTANILGSVAKSMTAKINGASSHGGNSFKVVSGTITGASFGGSTIPISQAVSKSDSGVVFGRIGCGEISSTQDLVFEWAFGLTADVSVWGSGSITTTKSDTLTSVEVISSGNMGIGSNILLYGVEK